MAKRLAQLRGFVSEGDVFAIDWAVEQGRYPTLRNTLRWPQPPSYRFGRAQELVVISDQLDAFQAGTAFLRPPSLVVGLHPSPDATSAQVEGLLIDTLAENGLARSSVAVIATAEHLRNDQSVRRLGYPIRTYAPHHLDRVDVPSPSETLRRIIGTQSVCEAAARLASGRRGQLIVTRTRSPYGTIAIARRKPIPAVTIDATERTTESERPRSPSANS